MITHCCVDHIETEVSFLDVMSRSLSIVNTISEVRTRSSTSEPVSPVETAI